MQRLFAALDPQTWETSHGNPAHALSRAGAAMLAAAARDPRLREDILAEDAGLTRYVERVSGGGPSGSVAYFSPEFGLHESLPIYSGGLGILAGDHLKAASDAGVAMVGVGLLYRQGYFRQSLDDSGWQHERYPPVVPEALGLEPLDVSVSVELAGHTCAIKVWKVAVGAVDLLLLDTDVEENAPAERGVTDRLYGGDVEHRLRQEIVLGIGGVRALRAAGYAPEAWHSNEGHAAFLGLERARELVVERGIDFEKALDEIRPSTIFTTHTPLPVAIDTFERALMERYLSSFAVGCDVDLDRLMAAGSSGGDVRSFNMAFFALRMAERVNGVSRLHGRVSRNLFAEGWPQAEPDDVPIGHVTNGVHAPTWVGPETRAVAGPDWDPATGDFSWGASARPADLWAARAAARARLIDVVRTRLRAQLESHGAAADKVEWAATVLDEQTLTIGFARRFAQYKRATLMLHDPERLKRLMFDHERPVQILVAGKAHPKDEGGKELIRRLFTWTMHPDVRGRLVFLEDYDMELGRVLTQGADVWLNNPRRPLEACGTSGMKAVMNGVPNCSVLDGWWDEMFRDSGGWAIGSRTVAEDASEQDAADAAALYAVLEDQIVPAFYDRDRDGIPRAWIEKMRGALALAEQVSATRMMRDYVDGLYRPALEVSAG